MRSRDGLLTNRDAGLDRGERSSLRSTENDSNMEVVSLAPNLHLGGARTCT